MVMHPGSPRPSDRLPRPVVPVLVGGSTPPPETGIDGGRSTLLVGNPNVGKSVIFGFLTGRYATVSNYPGTTVEICRARRPHGGGEVLDLPGTNSLIPNSEDERVTRDVLLAHLDRGDVDVVQVADAKNLRRAIALALQLAELEVPSVFVANMLDEAGSRGFRIDLETLGTLLGVEVLGAVATRRQGLAPLGGGTVAFRPITARVIYDEAIEAGVRRIALLLPAGLAGRRGLALMLLAGDRTLLPWTRRVLGDRLEEVEAIRAEAARSVAEPLRFAVTRARLAAADRIVGRVLTREGGRGGSGWTARLGELAMHPFWGLPVAALVLYLTYLFVGVWGAGTAVDFLENTIFAGIVTPWVDAALRWLLPGGLEVFLVGPPGGPPGGAVGTGPGLLVGDYGIVSMALSYAVAIVLPIVGFFFVAFSLMEDSGYLPRLAVMLNRLFRLLGLNGKAVLPMVLGLGCATMATMTARILPTRKERVLVTLLLALGVPCSAQLGVILGLMSALGARALLLWMGTVVLVLLAVGLIANRVLPGRSADFVLEIPPLRRPELGNVLAKTFARIAWYLREAVPLFILGTLVLWGLDRVAALGALERFASPVVQGVLGLPKEATGAFLIGFLRRDYGAAGLFDLFQPRLAVTPIAVETEIQVIVAMTTITLFVPCIANVFMIAKERGIRTVLWMLAVIFPIAIGVGGLLNLVLRAVMGEGGMS